jgi:hypothetical protein
MGWAGKRYGVKIAGFGVVGNDIARLMMTGPLSSLVRPLEYEEPSLPGDPDMLILLSGIETLLEVTAACRLLITKFPEDFVTLWLIGDIESASSETNVEIAALRKLALVTLIFPFPTHDVLAQPAWSPDPIIQTLSALVVPSLWDEFIDFDFYMLRDVFANTSGYVSVAQHYFNQGDENMQAELTRFLHSNQLVSLTRDAAGIFISIRENRVKLSTVIVITHITKSIIGPKNSIVLSSIVRDSTLPNQGDLLITIFSAKLSANIEADENAESSADLKYLHRMDIPQFLRSK